MDCFSDLFDKVLYMFRTGTVHHQEYLDNVYTRQVFVMLVLLAGC
jgi:hypothetical protein